jgi:4-hydroxy-2-oxoheptanedioate aldolase
MDASRNRLKQRLGEGETLHGLWLGTGEAHLAEIAASADFDWLLIDGEHGPNDLRTFLAQLRTIDAGSASPVVRLPDDDPTKIKQELDLGAQSLLIPSVESFDQAHRVVRAALYPPAGFRGVGAGMARASSYGRRTRYLPTANEEIFVMVQVESVAGMAALDPILTTPGLGGVFVGPADLAADMGYLGQPTHPDVKQQVLSALQRIRAVGLVAGILTADTKFIAEAKTAGANFVGVGVDVAVLANGLRALANAYRERAE